MAADTTQKTNNFVIRTNDTIVQFLDIYDRMNAIYDEYVAIDYGTVVTDEILAGSSSQHLDQASFQAGITSIQAIQALMNEGHGTNLQKFRR